MDFVTVSVIFSILGAIWFVSLFAVMRKMTQKYKGRVYSKNGLLFSVHDSTEFWKEILNPKDTTDEVYVGFIWAFRVTTVLAIIIGVYWIFSD